MKPYYEDEFVRLFLGDCLDVTEWLSADALFLDPPYGRDWKQGSLKHKAHSGGIINDTDTSVRDQALRMWGTERTAACFGDLMLPPPPGTKQVLVYKKPADAGLRGATGGFRRDLEAIYLLGKWSAGIGGSSSLLTTRASNVGGFVGLSASCGHPHAKPQDIITQVITHMQQPAVIADPFTGSGSILIAARNLSLRAVGVEIDERYAERCARRLAQGTLFQGTAS